MKKTFVMESNMTVATGNVGAIMITTPATPNIHLDRILISISAGPVAVNLLEDYSYVEAAASALTPIDANRQLAATSDVDLLAYPDITAVPGAGALTVAQMNLVTASSEPQKLGVDQLILKPSSTYLLAFTNSNAGDAVVNFALGWKE